MSDSSIILDTNEADDQLNLAIKMIVSAFENQNRSLSSELNRLNEELSNISSQKVELELRCSSLIQEKKEYEAQMNSLSNQNILLTQSIKELSLENTKLKNIKSSIIATIEKTDSAIPKNQALDGFSPTHMKTNIKFCKPMTSFTRNKHFSVDNCSQEYNIGTNQSLCKTKTPLTISKQNTTRNNTGNKVPAYNQNEVSKCNTPFGSSENILGTYLNKNNSTTNNNFFQNCRKIMSQIDYNALLDVVRGFNMKKLSKQETFLNITQILETKYAELLDDFKKLFFNNEYNN